jgi:hypothetical protein
MTYVILEWIRGFPDIDGTNTLKVLLPGVPRKDDQIVLRLDGQDYLFTVNVVRWRPETAPLVLLSGGVEYHRSPE